MRRPGCALLLVLSTTLAGASALPETADTPTAHTLLTHPVAMRGTLGDAQIELSLRPKDDLREGVEGEYFIAGRAKNVLLAGELEGEILFLEESENGTDVSGQWDGTIVGDMWSGEWQSPDGQLKRRFNLKVEAPSKRAVRAER